MTAKHLFFCENNQITKRETKEIAVISGHDGEQLGYIFWYYPWRQYVFEPFGCEHCGGVKIWSWACLKELSDFIFNMMQERRRAVK